MPEKKIFTETAQGKRVLHGTLTDGVFVRRMNSNGVRHSDKSLPLNPQCISQLWALGCETLQYIVDYIGVTVKYEIPFKEVFTLVDDKMTYQFPIVINEQGDQDIRIPVERFKEVDVETIKLADSRITNTIQDGTRLITLFGDEPLPKKPTKAQMRNERYRN